MRIAILGATSNIAKDLIQLFSAEDTAELVLFARRPHVISDWMLQYKIKSCYPIYDFASFKNDQYFDALINFVGVGNPAQTAAMGASIFEATLRYDQMSLDYLELHPECRYIFFSSGAVYGGNFDKPVTEYSQALLPVNEIGDQHWYAVAKLYAEYRHRAHTNKAITDIRVFNYFSRSADLNARFLITDLLRSIRDREIFRTSTANITRDYAGPREIYQLIRRILDTPAVNCAVDCYTISPIDKFTMLKVLSSAFGLRYELVPQATGMAATGNKTHYYSLNRRASEIFGYQPQLTSQEVVLLESTGILGCCP
jgi:nucleoside-diphosphate-sugar epimerase